MTIMSGAAGASAARGAASSGFSPTIFGRQVAGSPSGTSSYVAYANSNDFGVADPTGSAGASATSAVWVIKTATDCFIRVGVFTSPAGTEQWYNTSGTGQGDPGLHTGTGTDVFQLNELPDSVNIYNSDISTLGTPGYSNVSGGTSYTSDDKSTFFSPTQDAKYGRQITSEGLCLNQVFCADVEDGVTAIQVTFRKSGYPDYTIIFQVRARALASVEP